MGKGQRDGQVAITAERRWSPRCPAENADPHQHEIRSAGTSANTSEAAKELGQSLATGKEARVPPLTFPRKTEHTATLITKK